MPSLSINGTPHDVDVPDDTPLLWALRDVLDMTGTKYGCGVGLCGACTVHLDGEALPSCRIRVGDVGDRNVTTIEGLGNGEEHVVQAAWVAHQVPQCGFCQSGMVMAAAALLEKTPDPTDAQIDSAITNICRCGTYVRVRAAIHDAAARSRG